MKNTAYERTTNFNNLKVEKFCEKVNFDQGMTLKSIEKAVILTTLNQKKQNRTRTAKELGIGIRTLQRKLKIYAKEESNEPLGMII